MPNTVSEFQSLCGLHDDDTFMVQCGRWHNMEIKLVDVQNAGRDLFDETSEAKMLLQGSGNFEGLATCKTKNVFLNKSKIGKVPMCKPRIMLKLTSAVQDVCDVRTFCVKMMTNSSLVARRPQPRVKARSIDSPDWLGGPVGGHVQEEACARSESAEGVSAWNEILNGSTDD